MACFLLAAAAGCVCGILSAFGVGGGTILLIWLTAFAGMEQQSAQGINLLYFLPTAAIALPAHFKNGLVDKKAALPAILAGLLATGAAAWAATGLDLFWMKKCFGIFLLIIGFKELLRKKPGK